MALNPEKLATDLKKIYKEMSDSASSSPKDDAWFAEQLASAITNQIKTAAIPVGEVLVQAQAGVPNSMPIAVE
jgi:hypothetical protein